MTEEQLLNLLERFKRQELDEKEEASLLQWIAAGNHQAQVAENISKELLHSHQVDEWTTEKAHTILNNLQKDRVKAPVIPFYKRNGFRIAAAASIIACISLAVFYIYTTRPSKSPANVSETVAADVPAPGSSNAILQLADGTVIAVDSTGNGILASQGQVKIIRTHDGGLSYNGIAGNELAHNTLTVPRGGKMLTLRLADGTRVWLNSESSLHYPVAFNGTERKVEITGEVYFEVAPLRLRSGLKTPFHVTSKEMDVEVLGTHFNINAYKDEPAIKVTLLEGSVKIVNRQSAIVNGKPSGQSGVTLKPGEQAVLSISSQSLKSPQIQVQTPDLDEVMAWKDGYFQYTSASLPTILREAARWYNLEVVYAGKLPEDKFTGKIPRSVNLSRLLKWLEWSDVHFTIETLPGKTAINRLTILP